MREKKKFLFFFKQIVFYLSLPGANSHLECVRNPSYSNCSCVEVWRSRRRCLKYKLVQQATSEEENFLLGKGLAQALPLSYTKGHHCRVGNKRALIVDKAGWVKPFWVGKEVGIVVDLCQDRGDNCPLGKVVSPECGVFYHSMVH
jgi:hypothetical protein